MQEYLIFTQKGLYEYFGDWKMELFSEKVSKHIVSYVKFKQLKRHSIYVPNNGLQNVPEPMFLVKKYDPRTI